MEGVPVDRDHISQLFKAWGGGDTEAAERFMPLIYDELRRPLCGASYGYAIFSVL